MFVRKFPSARFLNQRTYGIWHEYITTHLGKIPELYGYDPRSRSHSSYTSPHIWLIE